MKLNSSEFDMKALYFNLHYITTIGKTIHLLPPWNICKFGLEISYRELVSFVCHEHHQHDPNSLRGLVMGFLLWEEGLGKETRW